jgi:hypothetical protein
MEWVLSQILSLIGIGLFIFALAALIAPLESLGWWAGWSGKAPRLKDLEADSGEKGEILASLENPTPEMQHYVMYLSGIGVASADGLAPDEVDFINELDKRIADSKVITDVYPYSVNNNPLTGQRILTPIWRKVRDIQIENPDSLVAILMINIRNLLQVAVSADPRYGPIYSFGISQEIALSLARHGYRLGSKKPIFLIGFSGGGQVAVGSAPYLTTMIEAPVYVLSIGGVISDDPGILQVTHLTHFYGEKDPLQKVGGLMWSGRWPVRKGSAWNRALSKGRIDKVFMGPMAHNAFGGYYDVRVSLPDGRNYCEATAEAVEKAIHLVDE